MTLQQRADSFSFDHEYQAFSCLPPEVPAGQGGAVSTAEAEDEEHELIAQAPGAFFALLEFEQPVLAPLASLFIGARGGKAGRKSGSHEG